MGARMDQLHRRLEQHLADRIPTVIVDEPLIAGQRESMQGDLGMIVRPEQRRTLETDRAVTKRGAFRAHRDDTDVLHHARISSRSTNGRIPPCLTYSTSSIVSGRIVTSNSVVLPPDSARTFNFCRSVVFGF